MKRLARLKNVDSKFAKHIDQADQGHSDQAGVVVAFHPLHQGNTKTFDLEGARAIEGFFLFDVLSNLFFREFAQSHRESIR